MTGTSLAQDTSASGRQVQLHRGAVKVRIGATLVGLGALVIPMTMMTGDRQPNQVAAVTGLTSLGTGTALIWSGVRERQRAVRPSLAFGVNVGRYPAIRVRRTW